MAEHSTIEWTEATWTPIRARNKATGKVGWHCEHASPGCKHCYSETFNEKRLGTGLPFKPGHRQDVEHFLDETMLLAPLRWRRPRRIFVCSMTDLFGEWVPDEWIDRVFAVMALCPQHTLQVLTKRSARMRAYIEGCRTRLWNATLRTGDQHCTKPFVVPFYCVDGAATAEKPERWPLPNVWLGVSAEDQDRANERVPDLLATPAAVRFVSAEPLLGPIDFTRIPAPNRLCYWDALAGSRWNESGHLFGFSRLDWIIVGGESGQNARPMHPAWARSIRDHCEAARVAFHFKQHGAWAPEMRGADWMILDREGGLDIPDDRHPDEAEGEVAVTRVGKKAAGRLLDGVEHNGMPAEERAP